MSDWAPDVAGRLEQIDRRLREIQAELVPGRVPRETLVPVTPGAGEPMPEPAHGSVPESAHDSVPESAHDSVPELGQSTGPDDRPRGRSGPLAEALERARDARLSSLNAASEDEAHSPTAQAREAPPAVPQPPPPPQPEPPPVPPALGRTLRADPRLDLLSELQSSLVAATRDLLDGYERASVSASERPTNRVTLSAGPFSSTESLRAFEQQLSRIPGVRDVGVRNYEGASRAIIEVELDTEA